MFTFAPVFSGCSAARLARVVRDDEAGGSNPLTPTKSHGSYPWLFFRKQGNLEAFKNKGNLVTSVTK